MKQKGVECENCGELVPEDKIKYINAKEVCQNCFFALKKEGNERKKPIQKIYLNWIFGGRK